MRRWAALAVLLSLSACQPDKASQERARAEDAVLTSGGPIDCTQDASEAARIVCADADLRALDREIAELWVQVESVTGRPNTMRRRHADWLAERDAGQMDWDSQERRARTAPELLELHQAYIDGLNEELRLAGALPETSPVTALAGSCIGTALGNCTAPSGGYVNGPDGQRLAWQIQRGASDYSGVTAGLILFAIDGEFLRPVGWSYEAVSFDAPVMFERPDGLYVAAEGHQAGTASANADILFRLDGETWTEIELESWTRAVADELPDGLGVWKGVDFTWPEMIATSSLWRDDDANCCPTGGQAVFDLEVSGHSLRLAGLNLEPAPTSAPTSP